MTLDEKELKFRIIGSNYSDYAFKMFGISVAIVQIIIFEIRAIRPLDSSDNGGQYNKPQGIQEGTNQNKAD